MHFVAPVDGQDATFDASVHLRIDFPDSEGCHQVSLTVDGSGSGRGSFEIGLGSGPAGQPVQYSISTSSFFQGVAQGIPVTNTTTYSADCPPPVTTSYTSSEGFGTEATNPPFLTDPWSSTVAGSAVTDNLQGYSGPVTMTWRLSRVVDADGDGVPDEQEQNQGTDPLVPEGPPPPTPVTAYAPVVYLRADEQYTPTIADVFIDNSELKWAHDAGCTDDTVAVRGTVDAFQLGQGGYSWDTAGTWPICKDNHDPRRSNENTAPTAPFGREGFYLDLADSVRSGIGQGTRAPVYYDYLNQHFVAYWFFYAYNDSPGAGVANHEGDWEHVTVRLDCNNRPIGVAYYHHDDPAEIFDWPGQEATPGDPLASPFPVVFDSPTETRPLVYSAIGTHASYNTPGPHPIVIAGTEVAQDRTGRDQRWDTASHLADLGAQRWNGYGGAWGELGNSLIGLGDSPQGPHYPDKKSAPDDANTPEGDWYGQCVGGT
jgi:hypothetical protein